MKTEFPFVWSRKCRSDRMDDIVATLAREPFLSIREIGLRLGLKKSPYLREMLIELVGQERIVYEWRDDPGGLRTMVFRVFHHEEVDEDVSDMLDIAEEEADARARAVEETGFPYVIIDGEIVDFPF